MANLQIKDDIVTETGFKSWNKSLRGVSSDNTPLDRSYVGFYSDVYDMLNSKDDVGISDVTYNEEEQKVTFHKVDGTSTTFSVADNFLDSVEYKPDEKTVDLILKDGENVTLNLSTLEDKFYTKEETEKIIENNKLVWGTF